MSVRRGASALASASAMSKKTTAPNSRVASSMAAAAVDLPAPRVARSLSSPFSPHLIVFDKDGTLIDFKHMWGRWADALCAGLERGGHLDAKAMALFEIELGYERATGRVSNRSPLCCSPMHTIKQLCVDFVGGHRASGKDAAERAINAIWRMPNPTEDTRALTDLPRLFGFLREERGARLAVCTTDDREVTEETLRWLKVDHLVDQVVCGDDKHLPPKPSPEQIFYICDRLGAAPEHTVMVGDTVTDMKMGAAAEAGLLVGIPNGAGSLEDLSEHADFILPSMHKFEPVFRRLTVSRS